MLLCGFIGLQLISSLQVHACICLAISNEIMNQAGQSMVDNRLEGRGEGVDNLLGPGTQAKAWALLAGKILPLNLWALAPAG